MGDRSDRSPNTHLRRARLRLRSPSGSGRPLSRRELADAVNASIWRSHGITEHLDEKDIGKLERGVHRWPGARRREAFRDVLGVGHDHELGFYVIRGGDASVLRWPCDAPDMVDPDAGGTRKADVDRREFVRGASWIAGALAVPTPARGLGQNDLGSPSRGMHVGASDVEALWSMCDAFTDLDHRLGGGHAYATLLRYLSDAVPPLLGGRCSDAVRRNLLRAVARLYDVAAFMAFDCLCHDEAQRCYTRSLQLTHEAGDRALEAHILADMSMQALHLGDATTALDLASAGQRAGRAGGSTATVARCHAMAARAHAVAGDPTASDLAINRAEQALDAVADDEPPWVTFFTAPQLVAETMYAAAGLGRGDRVQQLASGVLATSSLMRRRQALSTIALADSYIPTAAGASGERDIDRAGRTLQDALPVIAGVDSPRVHEMLGTVRARMDPFATRPSVQELDDTIRTWVVPAS